MLISHVDLHSVAEGLETVSTNISSLESIKRYLAP